MIKYLSYFLIILRDLNPIYQALGQSMKEFKVATWRGAKQRLYKSILAHKTPTKRNYSNTSLITTSYKKESAKQFIQNLQSRKTHAEQDSSEIAFTSHITALR